MEVRSATVDVEYSELARALTAHLTAVLLSQVTRDDAFEAPSASIMVQIDGAIHGFRVLHVVTDYTDISGLVLQNSALSDEDDVPNTLEHILIRFYGVEFEPLNYIYSMSEDEAVDNKGRTTLNLLEKLYTQ